MPRTARAAVGGSCYHALNCGNRRSQVCHGPDDSAAFVRLLRQKKNAAAVAAAVRADRSLSEPLRQAALRAVLRAVTRPRPAGSR